MIMGEERADFGSWMAQITSECAKKKMAVALFGKSPEIAGKENSLRGQDPGSTAGHPIRDKEEVQSKNTQDLWATMSGPGPGRRRIGRSGIRRFGWNHKRCHTLLPTKECPLWKRV